MSKKSLKGKGAFVHLKHRGERFGGAVLQFRFLPGPAPGLGISIPKKWGNAVLRNRCKRWVREAYRRHPVSKLPLSLHVLPRKSQDAIDFKRIETDFTLFGACAGLTLSS